MDVTELTSDSEHSDTSSDASSDVSEGEDFYVSIFQGVLRCFERVPDPFLLRKTSRTRWMATSSFKAIFITPRRDQTRQILAYGLKE